MRVRPVPTADPAQGMLFTAVQGGADAGNEPIGAEKLLATLADWAERGWIRRLDAALARFMAEAGAGMTAPALLATALAAQMEGRGHACLSIDELVATPERLLGWKPEPLASLTAVMATMPGDPERWIRALAACTSVCADELAPDTARPLVLRQGRLYLRRYWDYECRVALQVGQRAAGVELVDESSARLWLDRLFPDRSPGSGPDWQKIACALALRGQRAFHRHHRRPGHRQDLHRGPPPRAALCHVA